jgi:hypothetical protein
MRAVCAEARVVVVGCAAGVGSGGLPDKQSMCFFRGQSVLVV